MYIDAIVVHPNHCDYPLFRLLLKSIRKHFREFYIVLMNSNQPIDRTDFITSQIGPDAKFIRHRPLGNDWRHEATNQALTSSNSDYVLFFEQDFLIHKPKEFFDKIKAYKGDCLAFFDGPRMHPAFILVKRSIINKTKMDFAAHPPKSDHFGVFHSDLVSMGIKIDKLEDIGLQKDVDYIHMAGLSHNFTLLQNGLQVTWAPRAMTKYLEQSLKCGVTVPLDFPVLYERIKSQ